MVNNSKDGKRKPDEIFLIEEESKIPSSNKESRDKKGNTKIFFRDYPIGKDVHHFIFIDNNNYYNSLNIYKN